MTARTTLTSVLAELKTLCDLTAITEASADYGHFDDDSLQTALDKWGREEILDWQLVPMPRMVNGSKTTLTYLFPTPGSYFWPEVYTVVDATGTEAGDYTIDYDQGTVTFLVDTGGTAYFARGNGFWLDRVAAHIWKQKAALRAKLIQFKGGDHTLYEQQEYEHCIAMAYQFGGKQFRFNRRRRTDYVSELR